MILFAASQAHCYELVKALNKAFGEEGVGSRYAEPIISENDSLNRTLKEWFKKFNRKPYIVVSVDIMSTGVDIPCLRHVGFAMLTKSVGKYIQMIGRGTRLDPKTGKNSFKVLDFFGLCKRMEDNGRGTAKPNVIVPPPAGTGEGGGRGGGGGGAVKGNYFLIDNPDPTHLIQRVSIHGDTIEVIDNVPIEQAKAIFEQEAQEPKEPEVAIIKWKAEQDSSYTPSDDELDMIRNWMSRPEIYLDEGNLQRIYQFPQGTVWDFFLHAANVKTIPSLEQRIEQGFDSYLKTYNFTDEQIRILKLMRDIYVANMASVKAFHADEIFRNPIYEQIIGTQAEVDKKFDGQFAKVVSELEKIIDV
jgi:hypothetical protein